MKKYAWTLAEMVVAIGIMMMLTALCVSIFKPNIQKAKFYMYAAIRNITKGNITIIDKGDNLYDASKDLIGEDTSAQDRYCIHLTDAFSLSSAPNCLRSANKDTVNIMFPNGVTIKGLASKWQEPYQYSTVKYKNILIDINGSKGPNKIWADQFPMRIIGGSGKGSQGLVVPINCTSDKIYNPTLESENKVVNVDNVAKSPYCTGGKNYTRDSEIITYNIYRATSKETRSKAQTIATGLSHMDADCMAYGTTTGFYHPEECNSAQIRVKAECATQEGCKEYKANTYPEGTNTVATCQAKAKTANPNDFQCITLINKPSGGMSFIMQAIIGDITEF